jgi:hypothetical protein
MQLHIKGDISPCIVKDPLTQIGVPLVPGTVLDTDRAGIPDVQAFLKQNGWAFENPV